jgi:molybdopterin/thiamine biosynthesis adenylyltransferase
MVSMTIISIYTPGFTEFKKLKKVEKKIIVRMAEPKSEDLFNIIFARYPECEWGSFIRIGFHESSSALILTLAGIDSPEEGDLDPESCITEIQAQYTSKMLRLTDDHAFAVGFVHSHPESYRTRPSPSDYKMESYYADLLKPYTPGRPFVSLVFSLDKKGQLSATGRVFWENQWCEVDRFIIENRWVIISDHKKPLKLSTDALNRVQRLASQFSIDAAEALAGSTVGIVGAGGTGSPCSELLARAGVGKIIIIDPETFEDSNLERIHGSTHNDISEKPLKVIIAGRHIKSINPDCDTVLIKGKVPQPQVIDQLMQCDIVLGCTDLHSARVALSDISLRYLIPIIDVGVVMEGKDGSVTGQVVQLNRLFPKDPCVYCRNMVNSKIVHQELMSPLDQERHRNEAKKAKKEGRDPGLYWIDIPQLNTVGYLTTLAGSMLISYIIGYLTGRFKMTSNRIELNLSPHGIQVVEVKEVRDLECRCASNCGVADQDVMAIMSSAPLHWKNPEFL